MFRGAVSWRKSILTRDTPSVRRRHPLVGIIGKINKPRDRGRSKWEVVNSGFTHGPDVGGLETFPNEWKLFARREAARRGVAASPTCYDAYPKEASVINYCCLLLNSVAVISNTHYGALNRTSSPNKRPRFTD